MAKTNVERDPFTGSSVGIRRRISKNGFVQYFRDSYMRNFVQNNDYR